MDNLGKGLGLIVHLPAFWAALAVFVVGAVGLWFFLRWRKRRGKTSPVFDTPVIPVNDTKAPPPTAYAEPPVRVEEEALYACSCGERLTVKALGKHLLQMGKLEKGKHKSMGKVVPEAQGIALKVGEEEKYRAVIWRYPRDENESVIEFKQRIDKPLGNIWYAEPSLPVNGDCYCVRENKDGTFSPFDPRTLPITSKYTPSKAYKATHWDLADGVWVWAQPMIQKISTFIVFGLLFVTFVIILIVVGGE